MYTVQESLRVKKPGTGQFHLLSDFPLTSIIKYKLRTAY